jgi:glutathione S-transferase
MRTLYGLSQSPWTEKARWSLDHHSVVYRYHEHVPVLGELFLRFRARSRPSGTKASVPLLVDGNDVLTSSLAIARHVDKGGRAESLFPGHEEAEILRWADVSDRIIGAGRAHVLVGLRTNREAQLEAVPSFVPAALRGALRPMAVTAASFLGSKYDVPWNAEAEVARTLRPALDEIRAALGGRPHFFRRFTFADLAIAASLQVLRPPSRAPIGPGTRAIWTNEALAGEYGDLLAWRDAIYSSYRRTP